MADNERLSNDQGLEPCEVLLFEDGYVIRDCDVLFIDNRPRFGMYLGKIGEFAGEKLRARLEEDARTIETANSDTANGDAANSNGVQELLERYFGEGYEVSEADTLLSMVNDGLSRGILSDTSRIAEWLGVVNGYASFEDKGLRPLRLVIAHAGTHLDQIYQQVVNEDARPAGVVQSGSPKMLSDVHQDPDILTNLSLIDALLKREIPLLGICFGFQLLNFAAFDELPNWLRVPKGHMRECFPSLRAVSPCVPRTRRSNFGSRKIHRGKNHRNHPLLSGTDKKYALKVHSQYYAPNQLPEDAVLATSARLFYNKAVESSPPAGNCARQWIVEAVQAGPVAFGTQLHPELYPELLIILSHLPFVKEQLEREGHDLKLIRRELAKHPETYWAGQRFGYNFCKRFLAPDYIDRYGGENAEVLKQRLERKDPNYNG